MTLEQIPLLSWIRLAAGLFLFLGPGSLLLSFSVFRKDLDRTARLLVSFGFSVALWAILLSITSLLRLKIQPGLAIAAFIVCWALSIRKNKDWVVSLRTFRWNKDSGYRLTLWLFLFIAFLSRLWIVRHEVAGLGSDSYHHTLFTQMVMDQGMLPQNYGADSPIITFTYHFGFHAASAFLGWVSGIPSRLLLLVFGYILVVLCSAAVGLAAEKMVDSKYAGVIAAVLTASFFVFPAYMLLWGRYTQLTGLTLMALFLALFWLWIKGRFSKTGIIELGILAAGTGLVHYRMVALTAVAAVVLTMVNVVGQTIKIEWKNILTRGMTLILMAALGLLPWLFHIWKAYQTGYPVISAPPEEFYFSLQRLGQEAINYPLNTIMLILLGASLLAGWLNQSKIVIAMTLWSLLAYLPSGKVMLLDTVSLVISLFVPAAVIIAWGVDYFIGILIRLKVSSIIQTGVTALILAIMAVSGLYTTLKYPVPIYSFLTVPDLQAFDYIKEELPADAKFMVNLYRFPFSDILMIGSDAGYWIPLLTDRQTVVPPMAFTIERVSDPEFPDDLRKLEGLNGQLTTEEGQKLLADEKITHVYIGARGTPINPEELLKSPYFRVVYEEGPIYIFEVLEQPQISKGKNFPSVAVGMERFVILSPNLKYSKMISYD